MATKSVTDESIPPFKPVLEDVGFDRNGLAESAVWALNGAEAISTIIMEDIDGETKGKWSEGFLWHLHQGQQALLAFARNQTQALSHELWYTHALLGDYGEQAKADAIAKIEKTTGAIA
ncbi:hypothetical protein ACVCL0_14215 [Rhodanobacter sp. UC4450_H17]|jgi:hypothetical protein